LLHFFIIGNVHGEAQFGEFPSMLALLKHEYFDVRTFNAGSAKAYVCGATLITPNVALTGK
jgi:hypothetical protein